MFLKRFPRIQQHQRLTLLPSRTTEDNRLEAWSDPVEACIITEMGLLTELLVSGLSWSAPSSFPHHPTPLRCFDWRARSPRQAALVAALVSPLFKSRAPIGLRGSGTRLLEVRKSLRSLVSPTSIAKHFLMAGVSRLAPFHFLALHLSLNPAFWVGK